MPISSELKKIYASAPVDRRYLETLSFEHSRFTKSYYFIADFRDWSLFDEKQVARTFLAMPFKIGLPQSSAGSGNQDLRLAISNVGRIMMDELEQANMLPQEPILCTYRVYLDAENSQPQSDPLQLTIVDVEANENQITAVARRADILNRPFPYTLYRIDTFPGLDR